jgi:hypothetical protein
MDQLLRAGPSVLICVDSPGLIDSLKPLAPDALYIFRKYRGEQPLDNPKQNAKEHVDLLKPIIEKGGYRYQGLELYNEIAQNDLDTAKRFRDFQLTCLDLLQPYKVGVAVDNDPCWHPHFPDDWPALWQIKSEVYAHPAASWRCRHEYLPQAQYLGGYGQWGRHIKEIEWLRKNGKRVLPHIIGEWGWDKGPPIGPWVMGVGVAEWVQGAKDYNILLPPETIGYAYFGAGLDAAWPNYNLTSAKAPQGIIEAVASYMKTEAQPLQPDTSWAGVPEAVRRWYRLLADESFRHWPDQLIPFKGVELHGDRIGAAIIQLESGGDPTAKSKIPAIVYNGIPYHAWGLMQIICRVPNHPSFANRPTVEELLVPTININWGMAIFQGSLIGTKGDLWEALRRYSGFAAPNYTMADFWARYGKKVQETYERWFGIRIPEPETEQVAILADKIKKLETELQAKTNAMVAARDTLDAALEG